MMRVSVLVPVTHTRIKISNWPLRKYHKQPRLKMKGLIKLELQCDRNVDTLEMTVCHCVQRRDSSKKPVNPNRMHIGEPSGRWVMNHDWKEKTAADCSVIERLKSNPKVENNLQFLTSGTSNLNLTFRKSPGHSLWTNIIISQDQAFTLNFKSLFKSQS